MLRNKNKKLHTFFPAATPPLKLFVGSFRIRFRRMNAMAPLLVSSSSQCGRLPWPRHFEWLGRSIIWAFRTSHGRPRPPHTCVPPSAQKRRDLRSGRRVWWQPVTPRNLFWAPVTNPAHTLLEGMEDLDDNGFFLSGPHPLSSRQVSIRLAFITGVSQFLSTTFSEYLHQFFTV